MRPESSPSPTTLSPWSRSSPAVTVYSSKLSVQPRIRSRTPSWPSNPLTLSGAVRERVPDDVLGIEVQHALDAVRVPGLNCLAHDFHVLLRHRPPSIPPCRRPVAEAGGLGLLLAARRDEAHALPLVLEAGVVAPAAGLALILRGGEGLVVGDVMSPKLVPPNTRIRHTGREDEQSVGPGSGGSPCCW